MAGAIDDYMRQLERELRRRGVDDPRILAEAREHLVDAIDAGRERGLSASDAEREGLSRFGAPEIVAAHLLEERNRMTGGFRNTLTLAWQRKWWIAVPTVCAAIVAGVMTQFVMPPRYRAEAVILVVPQRIGPDYVQATVTTSISERLERFRALVMSRTRLERIIEDLGLYETERGRRSLEELVERMRRDIDVRVVRGDVFSLSFAATDPRTSVSVTERLASYVIDENLRERAEVIGTTSQFLDDRVQEARLRLMQQEAELQEHRRQNSGGPLSEADVIQYDVLKERYRTLLVKREDARVAETLERHQSGQQFKIIDLPRPPARPDGPGWPPLTLLGALAGLLIGLILAFLRPSGAAPRPPTLAEA